MDHRSFHDQLAFSIGFVVTRSRDLLRRLLKEHVTDDARQMLRSPIGWWSTWNSPVSRSTKPSSYEEAPPTRGHGWSDASAASPVRANAGS